MAKSMLRIAVMFSHGVKSIRLNEKRNYYRHIPSNASTTAYNRWLILGERFRQAALKVVGKDG